MSSGLARVTISAPRRRVDVALPEHLPLAELLPEVLRHAGEGLADDGERHGGWVLRRADGAEIVAGQALLPQGVRDGEVLHLVPARMHWPELEYDDVVEAIADGARRSGGGWPAAATRATTLTTAGVLIGIGVFAFLRGGPGWSVGAAGALGAALLLILAGVIASRAYGELAAGAALGGYAMPYAFTGGALLVASGDPVGVVGPVRWIGAPESLAGSVALLLGAVVAAVGVAAGPRVFAAGAMVGLLGGLTALAGLVLPAGGAAALLMTALVCLVGALPLLAIRFGRLPMPPITLPDGGAGAGESPGADIAPAPGARERPAWTRVVTAVARAEEVLTGLLIGHAGLVAVAAVVLVVAGGPAGLLLTGVAGVALVLRSRVFVTPRQRVPMLAAGLVGIVVLAVAVALRGGEPGLLGLAGGGLVLALVTVAAGAGYAHRPPGPYLGRAADILDVLTVVAVVPVACAVLGLYGRARGLLG